MNIEIKKAMEEAEKYVEESYDRIFKEGFELGISKVKTSLLLLKRLREHVTNFNSAVITNAVYISHEESMRRDADKMEAKNELLLEIDSFLERFTIISDTSISVK